MKPLNCVWFDDASNNVRNLERDMLMPLAEGLNISFMAVKFEDSEGLREFSNGILIDLVLVDHNLKGGVTGDQIIRQIRAAEHNSNAPIYYYSSNTQALDLQELTSTYDNVICVHRDNLEDELVRFFNEFVQ